MKRTINSLFTTAVLLFASRICCDLCDLLTRFQSRADRMSDYSLWALMLEIVTSLLVAFLIVIIAACVIFIVWSVVSGQGLIWRRIYPTNYLTDKRGRVVHTFWEETYLFRFHPLLRGRKLGEIVSERDAFLIIPTNIR